MLRCARNVAKEVKWLLASVQGVLPKIPHLQPFRIRLARDFRVPARWAQSAGKYVLGVMVDRYAFAYFLEDCDIPIRRLVVFGGLQERRIEFRALLREIGQDVVGLPDLLQPRRRAGRDALGGPGEERVDVVIKLM